MSRREKLLLTFLPPVILGGVYAYFFARPDATKLTQLEKTANTLSGRLSTPDPMIELSRLNLQHRQITEQIEMLKNRLLKNSQATPETANRPERIEQFNRLLIDNGLIVSDSVDVEQGKMRSTADVPTQLAKAVSEFFPNNSGKCRQVTVIGTYPQMLATLQKISDSKAPVVPMRISMKTISITSNQREWTILLWI